MTAASTPTKATRPAKKATPAPPVQPSSLQPPADVPQGGEPKAYQDAPKAAPKAGQVVDYTTTDPITGDPLSGVGLVTHVEDDGQLLVAPLTILGIRLSADDVSAH